MPLTMSIPLTQGFVAIVDAEDFERVSQFSWYAQKSRNTHYAVRAGAAVNGKQPYVAMHRFILGEPDALVDHWDGDGLNNQKGNLRAASRTQNQANSAKRARCSSKYKGVSWHRASGKWQARVKNANIEHHLGLFVEEYDAALAYNLEAERLFGAFARYNTWA